MTTIEDKVKLFSKIIFEKIEEEKNKKLESFEKEKEEIIKNKKEELEEKKKKSLKEIKKKAEVKSNEIIAREKMEKQQKILSVKQELIKETINEVQNKIIEFTNTDQYKDFLLKEIDNALTNVESGNYNLFLTKKDMGKFKNEIEDHIKKYEDKSVNIKECNREIIGGIILEDDSSKFRINNTLIAVIEENKEIIGAKVMERL